MATSPSEERRKRTRLPHKLRVILSGVDANGLNFAEETETVTVSKQGAAVRTSYHLQMGQELSVRTKVKNRAGQFQVVWMGKPGTPTEGKVGIEWLEPRIFWGIEFAPEDWAND
jgi:hypothetical protein